MNKSSNCKICGKRLHGRQMMYCSMNCKNQVHQSYPAQQARGRSRKIAAINSMGGKCSVCGYSKNLAALTLHHQSGAKEFALDVRAFSNRTNERVEKELKKCALLCHNCHAELHNPDLDLGKLSVKPTALTAELRARKDIKEL
jgi:predicted HNH restriction endonuclease